MAWIPDRLSSTYCFIFSAIGPCELKVGVIATHLRAMRLDKFAAPMPEAPCKIPIPGALTSTMAVLRLVPNEVLSWLTDAMIDVAGPSSVSEALCVKNARPPSCVTETLV